MLPLLAEQRWFSKQVFSNHIDHLITTIIPSWLRVHWIAKHMTSGPIDWPLYPTQLPIARLAVSADADAYMTNFIVHGNNWSGRFSTSITRVYLINSATRQYLVQLGASRRHVWKLYACGKSSYSLGRYMVHVFSFPWYEKRSYA